MARVSYKPMVGILNLCMGQGTHAEGIRVPIASKGTWVEAGRAPPIILNGAGKLGGGFSVLTVPLCESAGVQTCQ